MRRLCALLAAALVLSTSSVAADEITPDDARTIAREAFIHVYPMVENYLSIHAFALDPDSPDYKGPPNAVHNVARVFTPADRGVVTPNSDTPYSFLVLDLRAEPLVVTMPAIESDRYYSLQIVDLYSHNVDYLGTRRDGNEGGDFLIAGPGWTGDTPPGVRRVVRVPTEFAFSQFRTQLKDAGDLDRVKEIQAGYGVEPLSAYLGQEAPTEPPPIDWPPITRESARTDFWSYANFLLQFAPTLPWEEDLRDCFARIGVAPAEDWPALALPDAVEAAVVSAGELARGEIETVLVRDVKSSRGLFGSPEAMRGKAMERALGAMGGLYGLEEEEALYETYQLDADGERLDASRHDYVMRFPDGVLPPAGAFWSITMYDGDRFLSDNILDRYLINSGMAAALETDEAGDIVIRLQHGSPGPALESNWLPAPDGPMGIVLRIYLPEAAALDGSWMAPVIEVAND